MVAVTAPEDGAEVALLGAELRMRGREVAVGDCISGWDAKIV